MITDRKRSEERTGVQTSKPYGGTYDLQSDFVMVYRLNDTTAERVKQYKEQGFVVHLMTGVSWGQYNDYRGGQYDGQEHWDEGQVRMDGNSVQHGKGPDNPYMIPSVAYADYLSQKLRAAVDAGVDAIHMEEPEIWCFSGYGEWFKKEYELYYHTPWRPPHESAEAYYNAGKLKAYLYTRALSRIAASVKEYALRTRGKYIRFIVPTHSLINYTQYGISSPESMLLSVPEVDGYIAQVWTDTANVPNVYRGVRRERVFEAAFLEYGIMQELTRGTGREMWFLQDPVSDNASHSWEYFRQSYLEVLTAALLQPHVSKYEICPWPHRVLTGMYPENAGKPMPPEYLTELLCITQALRDMEQSFEWLGDDAKVGILLSDTMMYQRTYGYGYNPGTQYAEYGQESNVSGFYGMALPLLNRGIHAQPVQLENISRFPGYLDEYDTLCLSYSFMKPETPDTHYALTSWVRDGGALMLIDDGNDPFASMHSWWNTGKRSYDAPIWHLSDLLGLSSAPQERVYRVGQGAVCIFKTHPAAMAYEQTTEERYMDLLRLCRETAGLSPFVQKNYFALRRGPYVIAAGLRDSDEITSFALDGAFVDMTDLGLKIVRSLTARPGEYVLAADLDRYSAPFELICGSGRVEACGQEGDTRVFTVRATEGAECVLRFKCPNPKYVTGIGFYEYDSQTGTLLVRFKGSASGTRITIACPPINE